MSAKHAPSTKSLRAPILPNELEPAALASLDDVDLNGSRVDACALAGARGDHVRFDAVRLAGGVLRESKVTQLSWLDVFCERCDFSMIEWPEARWTRVEFRDCRLTGAKVEEAELDEVRFVECQLDYVSFAGARLRRVAFERCRLNEAAFTSADLSGAMFAECHFDGVDWSGAKLHGADVSTSTLREVRAAPADVRGLVVNREQAAALAQLFGLVIRGV